MLPILAWVGLAVALLAGMFAVIEHALDGFPIPLGSAYLPLPGLMAWWALWFVVGSAATLALARAASLWLSAPGRADRLLRLWRRPSDRAWVAACGLLAFVLSAGVCQGVLRGMPVVVDESAYRFMAHLVASGRVYVESYPDKLFYDGGFMINDGKFYAQYFLGWPALLAPFARLGIPEWANPVWFALSLPPLFTLTQRLAGSDLARLATLLYATAPFAVFAAATQMSHTVCAMWLAWTVWACLRSRDPGAPAWAPALLGFAFSAAFFTRPSTALGMGVPFLGAWAWHRLRARDGATLRHAAAFAVPAAVMAAAFLWVNYAQTGNALVPAYQRALRYALETPILGPPIPQLGFDEGWRPLVTPLLALFRLSYASYGWPVGLLFVPFALRRPDARAFWWSIAGMLLVHLFVVDLGVDTFGPVHVFELMLPLVVLTALGVHSLLRVEQPPWAARCAVALLIGLVVAAPVGYHTWRLANLRSIGSNVRATVELVADLPPSVVFVREQRWAPSCRSARIRHFSQTRPDNHPDLTDRVLWVNHVSVRHDQGFRALRHPDRKGFILEWDDFHCQPYLLPLEGLAPDAVPPVLRGAGTRSVDHLLRRPLPGGAP